MNTSGMIRGYMAKSKNTEEFIEVVRSALSREFDVEVLLEKNDDNFKISMKNYSLIMSEKFIEEIKAPYSVDKYILDEFKKQGFIFHINRSQYIQYCHGIYKGTTTTIKVENKEI